MVARAYAGVLLTVLFWGANVVAVKVLLTFFSAGETVAGRLGLAAAVLLALSVGRSGFPRWDARTWLAVAGVGLLGNAAFQAFFLAAIARLPAGISGLANAVSPVLVVLLSLALGQRPTARQGLGVLVSLLGMLLLLARTLAPGSTHGGALDLAGLAFLFLAALVWALYTLAGRPLTERLGTLPFVAFSLTLGALPYLIGFLPQVVTARAPWWAWAVLIASALASNVFAYLAWANGASVLGPARTSVWQNVAPLIALGLGALLLGERLAWPVVLAALIILGGVALANWPARAIPRPAPAPGDD